MFAILAVCRAGPTEVLLSHLRCYMDYTKARADWPLKKSSNIAWSDG
jgi:hypothetical protein